jgi:hypothetical protein
MAWLEESTDTEKVVDEKWLKIPTPEAINQATEVTLRILDESPVGTWRHWLGSRPYNCPGMNTCPVCKVRMDAKKSDPTGYKKTYKLDYRYFFNVLLGGEVKIYSFGNSVGRKLKTFQEKYGDLRDYDVTIQKRKTGPLDMNVDYDVFYGGEKKALSTEDAVVAETKYDTSEFIQPAKIEDLKAVAAGETPVRAVDAPSAAKIEEVPEGFERFTKKNATKADMIILKTLLELKNLQLSDFGFVETSPPAKDVVEKLIKELQVKESQVEA